MRLLIVMRGATGAGKSTFIQEKGLTPYTISPDSMRLLFQAPELNTDSTFDITNKNDKAVWKQVYDVLEKRMKNGDLTVIDATHTTSKDFTHYKALSDRYRYRVVCVDFSHIDKETLHKQNQMRDEYKVVSETVVEKTYQRVLSTSIPSWVTALKPEEFDEFFQFKPLDLSNYKKIHHIGDVHGCFTALDTYLKEGIKEDEFYIFAGDYIDRGIENGETLEFLFTLMERKNVIFLEGNHEIHLWNWSNDLPATSKEFERFTKHDLAGKRVSKKTARQFYRSLRQCVYYTYGEKTVLVTHGGLTHIPENLFKVSTQQLIKGVGDYSTEIDRIFLEHAKENEYQIHGHRNIQRFETQVNERTFNLEGQVEQGGHLRTVSLTKDGFEVVEVKNEVFSERFEKKFVNIECDNSTFLAVLRSNSNIREKAQKEKNISSFNFDRNVFFDRIWNEQTTKARGLFINTETTEIVARSYEKFFNVGEMAETSLESLKKNLIFPVQAYLKDNGFLGITGYDSQSDTMIIASKSTTSGDFKNYFDQIMHDTVSIENIQKMKAHMRDHNTSFVFEVIDPINDPHMVKYKKAHLVLLDVIHRTPTFSKLSFEELQQIGKELSLTVKEKSHTFNTWEEFEAWYNKVSNDMSLEIEGYVIEDADGFMTKIKLPFYSFWKWMRTVKDRVANGKDLSEEVYKHPLANEFAKWLNQKENKSGLRDQDIISLREEFEMSRN